MPVSESKYLSSGDETNKKDKLAINHNNVAMAYIVQVRTNHRGVMIIHEGKNTDCTDFLSHLFIDSLEKKMKPNDTMARVEFKKSCKNIIVNKNDDPTNIFENIISVQEEYGVDMDKDDEIALRLENAP